eukprot:gene10378-7258_t
MPQLVVRACQEEILVDEEASLRLMSANEELTEVDVMIDSVMSIPQADVKWPISTGEIALTANSIGMRIYRMKSQGKEVPQDVRGVLVAEQAVVKSVSDSDLEAVARQGQPFFVHSESASQLPDRIGSSHFVLGASPATVSLRSGVQQSHILTTERSIANVG